VSQYVTARRSRKKERKKKKLFLENKHKRRMVEMLWMFLEFLFFFFCFKPQGHVIQNDKDVKKFLGYLELLDTVELIVF
jgi:hypothetical protein